VLDILHGEVQQGRTLFNDHKMLWGGAYRYASDKIDNIAPAALAFIPASRTLNWYNLFVQDEWRVHPRFAITLGIKGEHNDYTGFEWLPSARFAWSATAKSIVWGSVSRAVRAPSRIDRELFIPGRAPFLLAGGPQFESEVSNVFELGYRAQQTPALSYSVTAFYHDHQHLRSLELAPGAMFQNRMHGSTTGIETWGTWRAASNWRLQFGWVEQRQILSADPGSTSTVSSAGLGNDPHRWVTLRSSFDLTPRHEFDVMARYVGALPNPQVPAYTALDARLGWRATKALELSLVLQNLFDPGHPEWGAASNRVEFRRGVFLNALWRP
jgi:iron complex outermembrane receptor protein